MRQLSIDIETYSSLDLPKVGAYKYAFSPDFELLLFAYTLNDGPVEIVDVAQGEKIPSQIIKYIFDENTTKTAYNANFERTCLSRYFDEHLEPESWYCTAVQAAMVGLPLSLDKVAQVMKIKNQKLREGKDLIRYFCKPCKKTKVNGGRTRNLPHHVPEKWELFKKYCIGDVEAEREIKQKLEKFPISDKELKAYHLDQEINDRGVLVDLDLVREAIECDNNQADVSYTKAQELGIDNPNSIIQLKDWLKENGVELDDLSRDTVSKAASETTGKVSEFLKLRLKMAKTSIKKYQAIGRAICKDNRIHGMFQFYGANRTGRFAGRLVQLQNLPNARTKDLGLARDILKQSRYEDLEMLYDDVPILLSELIRTAFVASKGKKLIVADFSAIEARVIAWLAKEEWRNKVFATHGKIYEASAAEMFNVPIEQVTKDSEYRKKAKISELALGYNGSVGALKAMGALDMGLKEEELQQLVNDWRYANPKIKQLWWDVDEAATQTVKKKVFHTVGPLRFKFQSGILFIELPSKRRLAYIKPHIQKNRFGKEAVTYEGVGMGKRWERIETYGGKLVENIVQAIARDILVEAMVNLKESGYKIVFHCHDEVVIEGDEGSLGDVCRIMNITPNWAEGLLLNAEGFEADYYRKG